MKVTIHWQAADGYVGGYRPQRFDFDLEEEGLTASSTDDEITTAVDRALCDDFENKVTAEVDDWGALLAEIRRALHAGSESDG